MIETNTLSAISPIDGRYWNQCNVLSDYFSEAALIRYRILIEVEYLIALNEIPLPELKNVSGLTSLRKLYQDFSPSYAVEVKEIEKTTNHDIKAIEYFLKNQITSNLISPQARQISNLKEFVHFGLTSQDINNTAFPLLIKECVEKIYLPSLGEVIKKIEELAEKWNDIPMLSRTHGQPASPTRVGKEMNVFVERLNNQVLLLKQIPYSAKFGGANGNFNAHHVAYSDIDWEKFADRFISKLGLQRLQFTTQIEHYDNLSALFDSMKRINNVLINFNRDCWTYISMDYFTQKINAGETGSSTMPHKVNPIDFENSEGNLGMANAIFEHLSAKLPISRLQRDLTDSTVMRNIGVPLAHSLISFKSLLRGLNKISVNEATINADLENNWAVVAEAIQTILRRENYSDPYEKLKDLTRKNKKINQDIIKEFIQSLEVKDAVKKELLKITPFNYTGI